MQMYANYVQTQSLAWMKETKDLAPGEPSETRSSWQALLAIKLGCSPTGYTKKGVGGYLQVRTSPPK